MTRVLLWDIDGTLLSTARAGVIALEDAAREVCGVDADLSSMKTSGLTDSEVAALSILTATGVEGRGEEISAFLRAYEIRLPDRLPLRTGTVLPGVAETLEALARRDDVLSLLLTGNTEAGARAKLAHYGLDHHFVGGAFCRDGDGREAIARRAMEVVTERLGRAIDPDSVLVVGDTPSDLRAAQAIGARALLVATGTHPLEELTALDPWRAFERMPTPGRLLELVGCLGSAASRT